MSIQKVLRTLKTVKRTRRLTLSPKHHGETLHSISKTLIPPSSAFLSALNATELHQILADPDLKPLHCFHFFNFIRENESLVSFKPDLGAHLTLISKLIKGRRFLDAEILLKSVLIDDCRRYPFSIFASTIENCCCFESNVRARLFNLMLKVYSDNKRFEQFLKTFVHMKNKEYEIDERTCTLHLVSLKRDDQMKLALNFLKIMSESGVKVSVYSLTVVVDGLCKNGEITECRELVEELVIKGIKPNIVTYNIMINACAKRWSFRELDYILALMEKEGESFNVNTYKILIDGYLSFAKIEEAERLVLEMHSRDLIVDTHIYNLIIKGYCNLGSVDKALLLFDKMSSRGVNWNVDTFWLLINGICKVGKMEVAVVYVCKMLSEGIELDQDMFNMLVFGYCNKGMIDEAFVLQVEMVRRGLDADLSICSKVVSGLFKLNRFEEAKELVDILVKSPQNATTSLEESFSSENEQNLQKDNSSSF